MELRALDHTAAVVAALARMATLMVMVPEAMVFLMTLRGLLSLSAVAVVACTGHQQVLAGVVHPAVVQEPLIQVAVVVETVLGVRPEVLAALAP